MSGRPHIKITESVEDLREILKQQKRILAYNKVQMLYLFQSKQVETVREVATLLGKGEATIHRWGSDKYVVVAGSCQLKSQLFLS